MEREKGSIFTIQQIHKKNKMALIFFSFNIMLVLPQTVSSENIIQHFRQTKLLKFVTV